MAEAIIRLLTDDALRMRFRRNAAEGAKRRFDLNRQVEAYLRWYQEILARIESDEKQWARQERNLKSTEPMAKP
jgi:hypothetical protein